MMLFLFSSQSFIEFSVISLRVFSICCHFFSKGDHDGAIKQYIKTIGHLEPSYVIRKVLCNKHLMTDSKGNSEFCFPVTLRETLRSMGNKTRSFSRGQSFSVLVYLPTQNSRLLPNKYFRSPEGQKPKS